MLLESYGGPDTGESDTYLSPVLAGDWMKAPKIPRAGSSPSTLRQGPNLAGQLFYYCARRMQVSMQVSMQLSMQDDIVSRRISHQEDNLRTWYSGIH